MQEAELEHKLRIYDAAHSWNEPSEFVFSTMSSLFFLGLTASAAMLVATVVVSWKLRDQHLLSDPLPVHQQPGETRRSRDRSLKAMAVLIIGSMNGIAIVFFLQAIGRLAESAAQLSVDKSGLAVMAFKSSMKWGVAANSMLTVSFAILLFGFVLWLVNRKSGDE